MSKTTNLPSKMRIAAQKSWPNYKGVVVIGPDEWLYELGRVVDT